MPCAATSRRSSTSSRRPRTTEVRAASFQFVRKLSGFNKPSQANRAAFDAAVDEVAGVASELLSSLVTQTPPRDRDQRRTNDEGGKQGCTPQGER